MSNHPPLNQRSLRPGQASELVWRVGMEHGISLGRQRQAEVFSTPAMINLMEHAAKQLLAPHLAEDEESVGADVHISHLAATPLGAEVRGVAEITAVDARTVDFKVSAFDPERKIGEGTHRRAVIDINKFAQKLSQGPHSSASPVGLVAPWSDIKPDSGPLPELQNLRVRIDRGVAIVTNHRPRALNALHPDTATDFEKLLPWLAGHADEIRVVILTGEGKSFSAGSDIRAVSGMTPEQASEFGLRQGRMGNRLSEIPQPVIAAINGYALGGGCVLAAHCDFRLASTQATFSMPEIKLGWPGGWGMHPLFRLFGEARCLELCLTGRTINASQAAEWGFLHQVVPTARLMTEVRKLADELLAMPPLGLRENKWLMHQLCDADSRRSHLSENDAYIRCLRTADAREGIDAFLGKRPPRWQGR